MILKQYIQKRKSKEGVEIEDSIMTITEKEETLIETPFRKKELYWLWVFVLAMVFVLFFRVFYLGVIKGEYYLDLAKGNRIRSIFIKAPRGKIFDKYGKILVKNIPSIDVIIIPNDLPEDYQERKKIAEEVSRILKIEKGNVEMELESLNKNSLEPFLLKENISQEEALLLSEQVKFLPGISLDNTATREYESSSIFSHVMGYIGKITQKELQENQNYLMTDYIGKSGIEKYYEDELRGNNGARRVEVDSHGNIKKNLGIINPEAGSDLVLNIDEELQKKIYDSLSQVLEKNQTKTAAAVAINPKNGGVLALVSFPNYDNNLFARGISNEDYRNLISDRNLPLFNRVVNGEYPPGSTLKPAVAVAALSEGIIDENTTVSCNGAIAIGSWIFRDWKSHGITDIRKAIAESCDVFFYSVGGGYGGIRGLGMDKMKKYEELFGFGKLTSIDLPGETPGLIPDEIWKKEKIGEKWYIGDSYHSAIGQGFFLATPIQIANYTASIANGGTLYSPKIVNKIKGPNSEEYIKPIIIRDNFVSKEVIKIVREGMRQTITSGSARSLNDLPVEVAGKTGTAQFGSENKTHAWFISFAPYEDPEIAMVILVEGGGEGSSLAVPVTKEVYDWYFGSKN